MRLRVFAGEAAAGEDQHRPAAVVDRLGEAMVGDGLLVIGTTPFIGEGFAPVLDMLFLAGPISDDGLLVQCAGLVVRAAPGKETAEVHDYHDPANADPRRLAPTPPGYRTLGFTRAVGRVSV